MSHQKRLVVCFDGTWNSADTGDCETNVARIARAVRATQETGGVHQIVLYLRGVGTTGHAIERLLSGANGRGVDDNIRSAYMFLAQNYLPARTIDGKDVPADEIFLFGFSRGAFTARSLGGFIRSCGLLKRSKLGTLPKAWRFYREEDDRTIDNFCRSHGDTCHRDVRIKFMGVWDTVGALGVPSGFFGTALNAEYEFHNTTPSDIVDYAYHALAVDEHRDEFVPTFWTGSKPVTCHEIEQRWFAGAHSDVGGGYGNRALADRPLVWMAQKAQARGLVLDWSVLPDPAALLDDAPQHESRDGLSSKDLLTPTYRQVKGHEAPVSFYERLYRPQTADGSQPVPINETIDEAVFRRRGKTVDLLDDDDKVIRSMPYAPKNLVGLNP
jgi:uncharacterized protein (DUF2235 family)